MGSGLLVVQVQNASGAVPISGAEVVVTDMNDMVLYRLQSDESGETEGIVLETVDKALSLEPGYQGEPYTSYNIEVSADGFNSLYISGVQIFDEEVAVQPAVLIPMLRSQRSVNQYEIRIGKHAVEMSEPRNQEKPIVEPIILRHVIIPDPITVHLGTPASSASNVQVSFTDYIKNVASSEIYPTWPEAALEANIFAVITFALNRVFTEWYRSRGYSFDITSSTAYDQSFQYGRTIYTSISVIVDRIFNQYIRRPEQTSPFFSSFCNGTTVTCAGMSQWGTVSLANRGMSPIQILRSYYPNDIVISETNIITGVVVSYPGTALRLGSTGRDVEVIQEYLGRIRRNYPAIPVITDQTGVFGASTQAAVKKFQSIFNLTADGIVGKATWNKISSIYGAVAKLSELNSEGTVSGVGTVPPGTVLRYGASGNDVVTLQYILSLISDFYPTIPEPSLNGYFDEQTLESVRAFQQLMRLETDGIVGGTTWNALYDVYWGIINDEIEPEPGPGALKYIVQPGDTLWLLAQRFGTTVSAIKDLNNLTSNSIYVNQELLIPGEMTAGFNYTVAAGDTLWLLAQRFGTTVFEIWRVNNLASDVINIGQILIIPQ